MVNKDYYLVLPHVRVALASPTSTRFYMDFNSLNSLLVFGTYEPHNYIVYDRASLRASRINKAANK
jgi:hypothetical protein